MTAPEAHFDLLVVGAGGAGLSCAIAAAESGLTVGVVEQEADIGGTLHMTGGMMSAAGTRRQREKGITRDSVELHLEEVQRIARQGFDSDIQRAAVRAAPGLIDWLDEQGFRFHEDAPAIYYGHEPYSVPRTYWGEAAGESVLEILRGSWERLTEQQRITVYLRHVMGQIEMSNRGVTGVVIGGLESGRLARLSANNVVIATGGFGSNVELFARITKLDCRPPVASMPGSQGQGLEAILEIGGQLRPASEILRLGRFPKTNDRSRVDHTLRADLESLVRAPREIWVNQSGQRFVDESAEVMTAQEHAVLEQPGAMFWAIFDSRGLDAGPSLIRGWRSATYYAEARRGLRELWIADSIDELAVRAGVDVRGLQATVTEWNDRLAECSPWGPRYRPMRIDAPPYFALQCRGSVLATFTGIAASSRLEVLDDHNRPIPHLFAIGETLGGATYTGQAYCGGMLLTPGLALGRELGKYLGGGPSVLHHGVTSPVEMASD
jgi:fumarate reductase flavoprotein subunit